LRKAIEDRGLSHLVAKSGEEAFENMKAELQGESSGSYDLLMNCNWMICTAALKEGGLYLLSGKEDGTPYCPICEDVAHNPPEEKEEVETWWIDGPADSVLEYCRDEGLVPGVQ